MLEQLSHDLTIVVIKSSMVFFFLLQNTKFTLLHQLVLADNLWNTYLFADRWLLTPRIALFHLQQETKKKNWSSGASIPVPVAC